MKKIALAVCIAALMPACLSAQTSTGYISPSATTAPNGWTDASNAYDSDDQYATALHQSGCYCPFIYLSWNGGTNYSSSDIVGPYGAADALKYAGGTTDLWGHTWTDTELADPNFVLKITNSSTMIQQGYTGFNFGIPAGSTIDGIEVKVEGHGDQGATLDCVDQIQVNVHYTFWVGADNSLFSGRRIAAYPNPVHDKLFIETSDPAGIHIDLVSVEGRTVMSSDIHENMTEVDMSSVNEGFYLLKVHAAGVVVVKKIIRN